MHLISSMKINWKKIRQAAEQVGFENFHRSANWLVMRFHTTNKNRVELPESKKNKIGSERVKTPVKIT